MFPRLPLTWPSPCSPQGSDSGRSRALSGLVWYVSICLIWSVHLSGLSGPIRVQTAADLRSHPQLQVAFWDAGDVSALSGLLFLCSSFSVGVRFFFPGQGFLQGCSGWANFFLLICVSPCFLSPSRAGCVMHLSSPLVPRRVPAGGAASENDARSPGCHVFRPDSQALRSSQDDLWATCWQCPSVLCPFALVLSLLLSFGTLCPRPHAPWPRPSSCFCHLSPLA